MPDIPLPITTLANSGSPPQSLTFPPDLDGDNVPSIAFQFYDWKKDSAFSPTTFDPLNVIFLPLPSGMLEQHQVNYTEIRPGWLPAELSEAQRVVGSGNMIETLTSDVTSAISGLGQHKTFFGTNEAANIIKRIDATLGENIQQYASNYFGTAFNPNSTIALQAPTLRQHSFQWTFASRNYHENRILQQIKTVFTYRMLPKSDNNGLFMTYPALLIPEFVATERGDNINNNLYTFKPCLIAQFAADPAPSGTPALIKPTRNDDATPAIWRLALNLVEIFLWTADDAVKTNAQMFKSDSQPIPNANVAPQQPDDLGILGPGLLGR